MKLFKRTNQTLKVWESNVLGYLGLMLVVRKKHSDVDVLVDFYPGKKTFDNYVELKELLTKIFGRPVDLVTRQAIKPLIKDTILKEVRYAKL